jgi:hypothetical protein
MSIPPSRLRLVDETTQGGEIPPTLHDARVRRSRRRDVRAGRGQHRRVGRRDGSTEGPRPRQPPDRGGRRLVLVTDGPLAETVAGIYADGAKTREWMGAAYQKSSDRANTAERERQRTARHRTSAGLSSWLSSRASNGTGIATLHLLGGASAPASHEAERGCERSGGRQRVDQHDPDATQGRTDHQQEGLRRCRQTTLPPSRRQYSADDRTPARSGE